MLVLLGGVYLLRYAFPLPDLIRDFISDADAGFREPLTDYLSRYLTLYAKGSAMIIVVAVVLSAAPSLLMSRFRFASKAIELDFYAIDPVRGIKKIFTLRTLKDALKACLYLLVFVIATRIFWSTHRLTILGAAQIPPAASGPALADLTFELATTLLGAALTLALVDMFLEYMLYIRDLKMTRDEVKREHKDDHGKPEIKQEQRRLRREFLSGEVLANVEHSNFVLANPTHIAIGIYINPAISIRPFISVMEIDERASAVIAHAYEKGVPVVRDIPLARRIFQQNRRYSFVAEDCLDDIAKVLLWLVDVEKSQRAQYQAPDSPEAG